MRVVLTRLTGIFTKMCALPVLDLTLDHFKHCYANVLVKTP